jgi:hypothetical protein
MGDSIYLEDMDTVVQYLGSTDEEVRPLAVAFYNYRKIFNKVDPEPTPDKKWKVHTDIINQIALKG